MQVSRRKIAMAIGRQAGRSIRELGDILRSGSDGWPIPADYTLTMAVHWPDPMVFRRVIITATINTCVVKHIVNIDSSARLLTSSYMEIAKELWGDYLLSEEPDFCAELRARDGG